MRLYHLSDLHLGVEPKKFEKDLHKKLVYQFLEEVFQNASKEGVNFILISGDIFDSNYLPSSMVREFLNFLKTFESLKFILLPGGGGEKRGEIQGHDAYTEDSVYKRTEIRDLLKGNIFLLTPDTPTLSFPEENIAFYGGFFAPPEGSLTEGINRHVAVMHGAFGNREEFGEVPISKLLEEKFDYLALGHYHRFKKISEKAVYSGAFVQFEYPASGKEGGYVIAESGYVAVHLTSSGAEIEYRPLKNAPKFLVLRISTEKDLSYLKDLLQNASSFTFIKISSYLEDFESEILSLLERYQDILTLEDNACLKREELIYLEALENMIREQVPEELQEEVKAFLLHGLQVTPEKRGLAKFLQDKYNL